MFLPTKQLKKLCRIRPEDRPLTLEDIRFHAIPGAFSSADIVAQAKDYKMKSLILPTFARDKSLIVNIDNSGSSPSVAICGASLIPDMINIKCSNGGISYIHFIDSVLDPGQIQTGCKRVKDPEGITYKSKDEKKEVFVRRIFIRRRKNEEKEKSHQKIKILIKLSNQMFLFNKFLNVPIKFFEFLLIFLQMRFVCH